MCFAVMADSDVGAVVQNAVDNVWDSDDGLAENVSCSLLMLLGRRVGL